MIMQSLAKRIWSELPERRQTPRVPITVAVLKSVGEEACLCQSVDISPTGMSMRRPKGLPMTAGLPVYLKFSLPGSEEVHRISAVVVRDDSEGRCWASAVVFGPLPPRLRRQLHAYIANE